MSEGYTCPVRGCGGEMRVTHSSSASRGRRVERRRKCTVCKRTEKTQELPLTEVEKMRLEDSGREFSRVV